MANLNPIPKLENLRPWQPGQSGNSAGHSKGRRMASELLKHLEDTGDIKEIILALVREAKGGSFQHIKEVFDRIDGKVPTPIEQVDSPVVDWSNLDNEGDTTDPTDSEGA
jgi:hypothetical protein